MKRIRSEAAMASIGLLLALSSANASAQAVGGWKATPPLQGSAPRICLTDKDDLVRVSHVRSGDLYLSRFNQQTWGWSSEWVFAGPIGGNSLALASDGQPYVAFNRCPAWGDWRELMLASRTQAGWTVEVVDPATMYGYDTSVAVDSTGRVHILAKREQDLELWYWTGFPGGPWSGEKVDADSNPGRYSVLALDTLERPHAFYSTWSPKADPRHAVRLGPGAWAVTTIDHATDTYRGIGGDLDANDHAHVVYHHADTELYYSNDVSGGWSTPLLIFTGGGKYAGAVWDVLGRLHVVTNESTLGSVHYLRREADGTWIPPQFVAPGFTNSQGIDCDSSGTPWIAVEGGDVITVYREATWGTYCTSKPTSLPGCVPWVTSTGTPSVSAGSGFVLRAGPTPGGNPGLFVYTTSGAAASPISNSFGTLCIQPGQGMFRVGFQASPGSPAQCNGLYTMDFNAYMGSQTQDPNLVAGAQVDFQAWYRDPANWGTANLTEAGFFAVFP